MSEVRHEAGRSAFMRKWEKFVRGERLRLNLMMLPGVVFVFLFNMMTLLGIAVAFQDFIPRRGWFGSEWVGLRNFRLFFEMPNAYTILRNTLVIAISKIVLTLIVAVLFALLLSEIKNNKVKRCVQTAEMIYPDRWTQEIPELRECDFGKFEARQIEELKRDPEYLRWMEDASQAPPGGESAKEVGERVTRAVDIILADMMKLKINRAAVVTHGGIIAMLLAAYGLPRRDIREWPVDFGFGWCVSVNPQRWSIDRVFEVLDEIPYNYGGEY